MLVIVNFCYKLAYFRLNNVANERQTLLDVGCGDGAMLCLIREKTPIKNIIGLDISQAYLEKAKNTTGCDVIQGSILNIRNLIEHISKFDYCILGAVLHHLIGSNRKESFVYAQTALANATRLLKPGGNLIVFEPTHGPAFAMSAIFWIKKIVGRFVSRRIELSARWINIGQPVVSYYTPRQLYSFIPRELKIISNTIVDESRLAYFIKRIGIGFIAKKV